MAKGKGSTAYLIVSLATLVAFGGVCVGTTYSLFTEDKQTNAHIQVLGDLKAKLYLKELTQDVLDDGGEIKTESIDVKTLTDKDGSALPYVAGKGVDLANYKGKIFSGVNLVPTMEGKATFLLSNEGDVAFNYSINYTTTSYNAKGEKDSSAAIASQINWTVTPTNTTTLVKKGETSEITVTYKFIDTEKNNDAMSQSMDLDIFFKLSSVVKQS